MMNEELTFEDYGHENGMRFWWASEYAGMLGYASLESFKNVLNKAIQACMSAQIDWNNDFVRITRVVDEKTFDDWKLSRFACYLVAMNADTKKPMVAKAQIYFAEQVEKVNLLLEGSNDMERLQYRDEIKTGTKLLQSAAKNSGVVNFGLFHDAGYRGMYNRGIKDVKKKKGIKESADHFDYMGRTELAANLFRITLTEEKLKLGSINSERQAMDVHNKVGKDVRDMVKKNTGQFPEDLEIERKLGEVKKELKKATKQLNGKNKK